jgi:hypothetical protein
MITSATTAAAAVAASAACTAAAAAAGALLIRERHGAEEARYLNIVYRIEVVKCRWPKEQVRQSLGVAALSHWPVRTSEGGGRALRKLSGSYVRLKVLTGWTAACIAGNAAVNSAGA